MEVHKYKKKIYRDKIKYTDAINQYNTELAQTRHRNQYRLRN